ncbi:Uncharacterised protein [Mycoplasmoides gallisepticum]|uniref:Uncharacterized protein n=1 Tax=Mycoplasmoides gallisepticum TaxID=2096 RepID=A0A3B0PDI0_MYCGL|nr:Uncharacterised protein [Mycoplasmoides gallisepticum]
MLSRPPNALISLYEVISIGLKLADPSFVLAAFLLATFAW